MDGNTTLNELYHWGIRGMKWGVRRWQNKDGSLTSAGRTRYRNKDGSLTPTGQQYLTERGIRNDDNMGEKIIPKGSKMYRATPYEKDGSPSKSAYVTYVDSDRDMYKSGYGIKTYAGLKSKDSVYEHEYELKTDIRIPSLKTLREIETKVMRDAKNLQEVGENWAKMQLQLDYTPIDRINKIANAAKLFEKPNADKNEIYRSLCKKYGDIDGDYLYFDAVNFNDSKHCVTANDHYTIEASLGKAVGVKEKIIKELQSKGYNAMYDNAGIGIRDDNKVFKYQEGVEPLIIFDSKKTLSEIKVTEIDEAEQKRADERYEVWKEQRDKTIREVYK